MKQVSIYAWGRSSHTTWEGKFWVALECQGQYKYLSGTLKDVTTDQCVLTGILEAVHLLQQPCALTITTASPVSFGNFTTLKGRNKALKGLLIRLLRAKKCQAQAVVWDNTHQSLRQHLSSISKNAVSVPPVDVATHYGVPHTVQLSLFNQST